MMVGDDLRRARIELGRQWRLNRPLFCSELGRALKFAKGDPGEPVRRYEARRDVAVPGPVEVCVSLFLRGLAPPEGLIVKE